jgi:hypothetical protein
LRFGVHIGQCIAFWAYRGHSRDGRKGSSRQSKESTEIVRSFHDERFRSVVTVIVPMKEVLSAHRILIRDFSFRRREDSWMPRCSALFGQCRSVLSIELWRNNQEKHRNTELIGISSSDL